MRLVAIVLAAGFSKRLGVPKQSIVWRGETLLDRAVRIASEVVGDVVVVVLPGYEVTGLRGDTPQPRNLVTSINPNASEGIASSIRAGVREAGEDARILITLCDQPLVTADHLRTLIAIDAPIVATAYSGIAGVPAIFAPQFVPELLALRGDVGARSIIEKHGAKLVFFDDAAIDVDE